MTLLNIKGLAIRKEKLSPSDKEVAESEAQPGLKFNIVEKGGLISYATFILVLGYEVLNFTY